MKKVMALMLLLCLSALLIPIKVQSQDLPENVIELTIINSLNVTRTDEPVIIRWINLTDAGVLEDANPDSFRIIDENETEVPCQFDDLTDYGYEKYFVFPATVASNSSANYTLYYTTESWPKPEYSPAVNMTETDTGYDIVAETYSCVFNESQGIMAHIKTTHSGELVTHFGASSYGAPGWNYGWMQVGINDSQTELVAQGPVRSIIAAKGEVWYNDAEEKGFSDPGSSDWNFTTIYLLYKDRVEAMTHQDYTGEGMQLCQARVGISHSVTWMLNGPATLDTPLTPFTEFIQDPYSGYDSDWAEWAGCVWTIYPIRDNYPENGKWVDLTSINGSFGYGAIIYDSANMIRFELGDGRSWGDDAQDVLEPNFIQINMYPTGPVPPAAAMDTLWYHWVLIPHEDVDYTFTQAECEKAYSPLGFTAVAGKKKGLTAPVWVVYSVFFAAATAVVVLFARKLRT